MDADYDYGYGSYYRQDYDIYSLALRTEWINEAEIFGNV